MGSKLFVGNLDHDTTGSDLEQLFAPHGTVQSARVIADRETGRGKGFGFVDMASPEEAQKAIAALDGQDRDGKPMTVNEARPRPEHIGPRPGQFGDRGGRGSGGDRSPGRSRA